MDIREWLPAAIRRAVGGSVPVDGIRQSPETRRSLDASGRVASVVYRQAEDSEGVQSVLDGSAEYRRVYEIECRAPTAAGADAMAEDILAELRESMLELAGRYDMPDDDTQKELGYFSHVLEVVMPVDGLPDE